MSGELNTCTAEAETIATGKSQVNDSTVVSEADNDSVNMSLPVDTVSGTEAPSVATAGTLDRQTGEVSSEPASCETAVILDTNVQHRNDGAREATAKSEERSDTCSVSCVRDLINTTIEKTLQDAEEHHRSLTPPSTVAGNLVALTLSLLDSKIIFCICRYRPIVRHRLSAEPVPYLVQIY